MTKVQKVHSLTGRITPALVHDAWRAARRNRGVAGIDKVSIQMFQANLDQNLDRLMRELKTGAFEPLPARRVYIPKSPGKFRPLGIPAVRDRVAQEVIRRLLSPIFERRFHDDSYGFRPGRSCHQAVESRRAGTRTPAARVRPCTRRRHLRIFRSRRAGTSCGDGGTVRGDRRREHPELGRLEKNSSRPEFWKGASSWRRGSARRKAESPLLQRYCKQGAASG